MKNNQIVYLVAGSLQFIAAAAFAFYGIFACFKYDLPWMGILFIAIALVLTLCCVLNWKWAGGTPKNTPPAK